MTERLTQRMASCGSRLKGFHIRAARCKYNIQIAYACKIHEVPTDAWIGLAETRGNENL